MKKIKKRKKPNYFLDIFLTVFLGLIFLGLFFLNFKIYQRKSQLKKDIANLEAEILKLEKENKNYQNILSGNLNDYYLEKVFRDNLLLKKKGEKVISFVFPEKEEKGNIKKTDENNFLTRFKNFFRKLFIFFKNSFE